MVQNPPENMPQITPYLYYEDLAEALDWLSKAFDFKERLRLPSPDGGIQHAEMELGTGVIMMGTPSPDYQNPRNAGHVAQLNYVYVDDVDAHYKQAVDAGATILTEPEDQWYGDRHYMTEDLEGHHWCFVTHLRDTDPSDMPTA